MRTAIVFFVSKDREKALEIVKALARGMQSQGHQVDIIDGVKDVNAKLTIFEYLAVGTEPTSLFGGKIPSRVGEFLANSGIVTGKRSFAFSLKRGFAPSRALSKLMKVMEHEGMFLKYSDVLISPEYAEAIGKRLHIG